MDTANAKRLMIFIDENDRYNGAKLADEIIQALRKHGCAGATAIKGIEGYGVHKEVHSQKVLGFASNLPIVIVAIDEAEKIDSAREVLRQMIEEGLMVVDSVHAERISRAQSTA